MAKKVNRPRSAQQRSAATGKPPVRRSIRRAQTVSPFGVGAIYDIGDESFAAMDTLHWGAFGEPCDLPRLAEVLGVKFFRLAPTGSGPGGGTGVPFYRFPRWLFCPSCRQMSFWSSGSENGRPPKCSCARKSRLAPMRFVAACRKGHLSDVPWGEWSHSKPQSHAQRQCAAHRLVFEVTAGAGGGLGALRVRCSSCTAGRTLEGIASPASLASIGLTCKGSQPWQTTIQTESCQERPQVLQRGASNLHFSRVASALDIPSSDATEVAAAQEAAIRTSPEYGSLKVVAQINSEGVSSAAVRALANVIAGRFNCSKELVNLLLAKDLNPSEPERKVPTEQDLLAEEWSTLNGPSIPEAASSQRFVSERADWHAWVERVREDLPIVIRLGPLINSLSVVHRLREVRALVGFERVEPGTLLVRPSLASDPGWLPALEVFGEGIFLALNEEKLDEWTSTNSAWLDSRLALLRDRQAKSKLRFVPTATPRLLLVHTLAHLLVRQLSFECGYSASSLRERIFSSNPEGDTPGSAGLLIYTADADSEGSMGGLARQGRPDRFLRSLTSALSRAGWCSGDPICAELPAQGLAGLNRAACHSCALVSETSCQWSNVLLDRTFVVGEHGFFGDWLGIEPTSAVTT